MGTAGLNEMIQRWNKIKMECHSIDNEAVVHLVRNSIEFDDQLDRREERKKERETLAARRNDPAYLGAFKSDEPMCEADE